MSVGTEVPAEDVQLLLKHGELLGGGLGTEQGAERGFGADTRGGDSMVQKADTDPLVRLALGVSNRANVEEAVVVVWKSWNGTAELHEAAHDGNRRSLVPCRERCDRRAGVECQEQVLLLAFGPGKPHPRGHSVPGLSARVALQRAHGHGQGPDDVGLLKHMVPRQRFAGPGSCPSANDVTIRSAVSVSIESPRTMIDRPRERRHGATRASPGGPPGAARGRSQPPRRAAHAGFPATTTTCRRRHWPPSPCLPPRNATPPDPGTEPRPRR